MALEFINIGRLTFKQAVILYGTGAVVVECNVVPIAGRYRFRVMILGVETDYRLVASSTEPIASIRKLSPGETAQIIVQAVSGSLQGVARTDLFHYASALGEHDDDRDAGEQERAAGGSERTHRRVRHRRFTSPFA